MKQQFLAFLKVTTLLLSFLFAGHLFAQNITGTTTFLNNLKLGDRGVDVQNLQKILNQSPETQIASSGPGAPGQETDYFGSLTLAAVIKFQEKYAAEILTPAQLMRGTGYVGAMTRKKLNELATTILGATTSANAATQGTQPGSSSSQTSSGTPVITSISPSTGSNGTDITIKGEGFTPTGNKVQTTLLTLNNVSSADGKTIMFKFYSDTVNTILGVDTLKKNGVTAADLAADIEAARKENPQSAFPVGASFSFPLFVSVTNSHGLSNTMQFGLDMDPTHYLATSTAVGSNGNSSLLGKITSFFESFSLINVAEARCDWSCLFNMGQGIANGMWSSLTSRAGGGIGNGPAFGGNVILTIPCICSGSTAFIIRPVSGSPGPYNVAWWDGALKAQYALFPGNWVLGSAPLGQNSGVCSIWAVVACFNYNAAEVTPLPGVGTSLVP